MTKKESSWNDGTVEFSDLRHPGAKGFTANQDATDLLGNTVIVGPMSEGMSTMAALRDAKSVFIAAKSAPQDFKGVDTANLLKNVSVVIPMDEEGE